MSDFYFKMQVPLCGSCNCWKMLVHYNLSCCLCTLRKTVLRIIIILLVSIPFNASMCLSHLWKQAWCWSRELSITFWPLMGGITEGIRRENTQKVYVSPKSSVMMAVEGLSPPDWQISQAGTKGNVLHLLENVWTKCKTGLCGLKLFWVANLLAHYWHGVVCESVEHLEKAQ